ncbi:MAG: glycosyltransferase family 2 protein [Clostridiaceae bacterium]|nr:glycosyltransferase family 2 protein [Clostridiaceae bacterium]
MKLSIIIVNYNTELLLKQCIESVFNSIKGIEYEIIVVDNDSKDNSVKMLRTSFPYVRCIENKFNAGFAKANNQGYKVSNGKYILLLNSDTIVLEDAINKLVNFIEKNKEVGVVGPRLLNQDLTLQLPCRRGFPKLINSFAHFSGLSKLFSKSNVFGSYNMTYMDDSKSHEVDAVSGACLLISRYIIEKVDCLLDEEYFMHFEDIDLCYRVKKNGWKIYYIHDSEVIHLKGQSSKLRSLGVIKNFYDSASIYYKKNYKCENILGSYIITLIISIMKLISVIIFSCKGFVRKEKVK